MSKKPIVSIITPCYNYGKYLSEALDSLINQSYLHWECIIVNDGSNDNTEEIALKYKSSDSRFIYQYQNNHGQWVALNKGLKTAKGKYIQFLDADDMLQPEKLYLQVLLLEENADIDLVYSDILKFEDKIDQERKFILYHQPDNFPATGNPVDIIKAMMLDNFYLPGCVIMRKNIFDVLNAGFRSAKALQDWDLWFRVASAGFKFYHDDREGTRLLTRHHNSNISLKPQIILADRLNVRKMILEDFIRLKDLDKLELSSEFVAKTIADHKRLLAWEKASYHLNYGNVLKGFISVAEHAYYSGKPFYAVYDGAHYLKERIKRSLK